MSTEKELERKVADTRGELINRTSPDAFAIRLRATLMQSPVFGKQEAERADINRNLQTVRQDLTANLPADQLANLNPAQQRALVQGTRAGLSASYSRNMEETSRLGAGVDAGVSESRAFMKDIQDNLVTRLQFLTEDLTSIKAKKSETKQLAFGLANTGVAITPEINAMLDATLSKDEKSIWLSANQAAIRKSQSSGPTGTWSVETDPNTGQQYKIHSITGETRPVNANTQTTAPPQTFESFLGDKQKEAGMSFAPAKVEQLKQEFNQKLTSGNQTESLRQAFDSAVIDLSGPQMKNAKTTFNSYITNGNLAGAAEFVLRTARSGASTEQQGQIYGRDQRTAQLTQLKKDLAEFERLGGKTGVDIKFKEGVAQIAGRTSNPKLASIQNRINSTIQQYTRAISGAAFTDQEYKRYQNVFPDIGKTQQLNVAKIDSLIQASNLDQDTFYRQQLGGAYDTVKPFIKTAGSSERPPISSFLGGMNKPQ